jgi:putative transposase
MVARLDNKTAALAALNIPRSSFYYHSVKEAADLTLKESIETLLVEHPSYGHRRIAIELKANKKKIRRIMHKYDIRPRRGRKSHTYKVKKGAGDPAPNLLAVTLVFCKNQVWVTDFTYIKWHGRCLYLCTVIDLYTREVIGVSIKTNHSALLVAEALLNALTAHGPPSLVHSDQGSEYRSRLFQSILSHHAIAQSMSKKGSPWQNGYQESFYSNFKIDIGDMNRFETEGELIAELYRSIYYYNNLRIHLVLGCPPRMFAKMQIATYTQTQEKLSV